MKRTSVYATMTASDLARITRERGLDKSSVVTLSDWANLLEADDEKKAQVATPVETPVEPKPADTKKGKD